MEKVAIKLEEIINFRELAKNKINKNGKMIIPSTIYRSGIIKYASENDILELKAKKINYIYDFRSSAERIKLGELDQEKFVTKHFDILAENPSNHNIFNALDEDTMFNEMITLYSEVLPNALNYGKVILEILKQETTPFLFHCSSGKDRTGVFGIILMLILDFDLETIKEEYLLIEEASITFMREHFKTLFKIASTDSFEPLIIVHEAYFDAFVETVVNKYGSIESYLLKLGVTAKIKREMNQKYLMNKKG